MSESSYVPSDKLDRTATQDLETYRETIGERDNNKPKRKNGSIKHSGEKEEKGMREPRGGDELYLHLVISKLLLNLGVLR